MADPKYVLNSAVEDGVSSVILALVDPEIHDWIKVGEGKREIPTIKLTPQEAMELAAELIHYADYEFPVQGVN
jgi:hypothetical protein